MDLKEFWTSHHDHVDVGVATTAPDKLLGVRDGFLRYFHDGLERPLGVGVKSVGSSADEKHVSVSDEEMVRRARAEVLRLREELDFTFPFLVTCESGLHSVRPHDGDVDLHFVRVWAAVEGPGGCTVGGSGSLQLPPGLIAGLEADELPFAVPGRRRRGGMMSSLTGGLQTRRRAIALAVLHALSSQLYGVVESRPLRGPSGRR